MPSSVMTTYLLSVGAARARPPRHSFLWSPRLMALPKQVTKESFSILSAPAAWAFAPCLAGIVVHGVLGPVRRIGAVLSRLHYPALHSSMVAGASPAYVCVRQVHHQD